MRGAVRRWKRPLVRWLAPLLAPVIGGVLVLVLPLREPFEVMGVNVPSGADSVRVVAGERYGAGSLQRWLLGSGHRQVWTEPLVVAVLRLDRFDGGLRPVREGGGNQTRSLYLISDSLRRWIFRSLDKEPGRLLDPGLQGSLLAGIVQDYISAEHPGGAFVAMALQRELGLPSTDLELVALPDDPRLGRHRARFAGLLGILQRAPGPDWTDTSAESSGIAATEEILTALDSGVVDRTGFLTARLLDFLLNDWDRHQGQWRWVGIATGAGVRWRAIPMDRDQALSSYGGLVPVLARIVLPQFREFGPRYPPVRALTHGSTGTLDRRVLAHLSRREWDSVARFVRVRLTDPVVDSAVGWMPEPWRRLSGGQIAATLKARRDGLPEVAAAFYRMVH